jgi:hypothetical protein
MDEEILNGETNFQIDVRIESTNLRFFCLYSDRDVTIKTNSTGSPQETWALKANRPIIWATNLFGGFPIAGDVTALFITNVSGATASVKLIVGRLLTPH